MSVHACTSRFRSQKCLQLYVALSRGTHFARVRVVAENYEDKQLVTESSTSSGDAASHIHTLNIVDRDLLTTAGHEVTTTPSAASATISRCKSHANSRSLRISTSTLGNTSQSPSTCEVHSQEMNLSKTETSNSWRGDACDIGEDVA